jgi:hypothetical protein
MVEELYESGTDAPEPGKKRMAWSRRPPEGSKIPLPNQQG